MDKAKRRRLTKYLNRIPDEPGVVVMAPETASFLVGCCVEFPWVRDARLLMERRILATAEDLEPGRFRVLPLLNYRPVQLSVWARLKSWLHDALGMQRRRARKMKGP